MKHQVPHIIAALAVLELLPSPSSLYANGPQVLLLDGKVRTKVIPLEGARLIVERNGITVQVMTSDLKHFQLQLDLQQEYVLTFHRESCLSKSLHIDTHVPEEVITNAPFQFPCLVTLEPRPKGPVVRYAEPVGEIHFDEGRMDFVYGTDYSLARDRQRASVKEDPRNAARMEGPGASTSSGADRSRSIAGPITPLSVGTGLSSEAIDPNPAGFKAASAVAPERILYGSLPDGRTEELLVRPTYVAKEIRITERGCTVVYRKVTHRFGAVNYFCNGGSCTEASFLAGTRRSTSPAP